MIRGSLLAIPIEKSLLYVQPLYLAAEKGSLPELKRVITAFGNQIAMEETLEKSLQSIFSGRVSKEKAQVVALPEVGRGGKDVASRALERYRRSQEFLSQGNWAGFGEELKRLEALLKEMQKSR